MNKNLMRQALTDPEFEHYFQRYGGGYLNYTLLFTLEECIERFIASDEEWLKLDHTYCPLGVVDESARVRKVATLLETMTLQEIRKQGRPMEQDEVRRLLHQVRNPFRSKVWRYYVTFLHDLPPQHPEAKELHKAYSVEWPDTGLIFPSVQCAA